MTNLGLMHYFLGIEIAQFEDKIFIAQKKYTTSLLKKFKMEGCKTVATPLDNNKSLRKEDGTPKADGSQFQSLIGSLLYLRATRPDMILLGYTDSDWVGSVDDMKSTSGYAFTLGSEIFSWASKKKAAVAQSLAEAEYIAAAMATSQAIWLKRIFEGTGEPQNEATEINCDSK
ncbi:uncharacterized protein LOC111383870 [Olea europaea var. sylvestris]|uniref:uncharacterized protein LOC111383870 n=1 Tax=Olea europaea var. sylvestris TaxID=158386 RepID=UPI000C1D587A|nr:uncharacterized protein LOC111383870 [Olea europaea var. sylvestris]